MGKEMFKKIDGIWEQLSNALGVDVYDHEKYGYIECMMVGIYIVCRYQDGDKVCYEIDNKGVVCSSGRVKNRKVVEEFVEFIENEF